MLILTRKSGESFSLYLEDGRTITIKMLEVYQHYNKPIAKIGIEAPRTICVLREEISASIPAPCQQCEEDAHLE